MRKLVILFLLILNALGVMGQKTVLIKTTFERRSGEHCYMGKLIINDTVIFKKLVIDTNYFEFNVPKFLLSKKPIVVTVEQFTQNEIRGVLCDRSSSISYYDYYEKKIPVDSILQKKEFNVNLDNSDVIACGSFAGFRFMFNSCNIDSAFIYYNYSDSLFIKNNEMEFYCIAETLRKLDNDLYIKVIGNADKTELDPQNLSLKRAETIKDYFIQFGIAQKKLIAVGQGFEKPKITISEKKLNKLSSKEKKQLASTNARVTISITPKPD